MNISTPIKHTLVLSLTLSSALYAAPQVPDSGNVMIKTQTENKLSKEIPKVIEQSGINVIARVLIDSAIIVDAPRSDAKVVKTLHKNDKLILNGIEKDGYYEVQEGGYIDKHSVEILSKVSSVSLSKKGNVRIKDSLVEKTFAHYTQDGITAQSTDSALTAVKTLGAVDAAVFLKRNGDNYDATLGLVEGKPFSAYIGEDNYGDHTTGVYRTTLGGALNDIMGYGEKVSATVVATGHDLVMGSFQASLPISNDANRVYAGVSRLHYALGDVFASIDATGSSTSGWLGYNKPLWLSYRGSFIYDLKVARTAMVDKIDAFSLTTNRKTTTMDNALSFMKQDAFMGGGTNGAYVDLKLGKLDDDSATDPYNKVGHYAKVNVELQRVQNLGTFTGIALIKGQKAFDNLDSSEKFNLTGVNAVGGYYTGDIVGDEGIMGSLEIDHAIPVVANLSGGVIYTNGAVKTLHTPIDDSANIQRASSAGFKLSYLAPYDIFATLGAYKRITGESVNNYDNPYHVLFNIAKKF